ncbi:MAG TPA: hypothetical protein VGK93_02930 [Candidatus Eisenbacteria bacterium]|jgi:hypothetical protein
MKTLTLAVGFAVGMLAGCMASGPPLTAQSPTGEPASPLGSPFSDRHTSWPGMPLVIDRTDLRIGTTVQFERIPSSSELYDLNQLPGLAHIVLALPAWPAEYAPLEALSRVPEGADLIVVLPGYPPSREAAEAWNLVSARLRLIVVVQTPPPSTAVVGDLNTLRGLERVIAELDQPARSGFERLQRPLSFRKVIE